MIDDSIIVMAKEIAARHALDGALVCAIIEQESAGEAVALAAMHHGSGSSFTARIRAKARSLGYLKSKKSGMGSMKDMR